MHPGLLIAILLAPVLMAVLGTFSWFAAEGRVPRNHLVGIRLPSTEASDAAWRAGHRAAIRPSWISCAVLAVADVVAVLLGRSVAEAVLAVGVLVLLLAAIVGIMAVASFAARRAV